MIESSVGLEEIPVRSDHRFDRRIRLQVELVEVLGPVIQSSGTKPFDSPTVAVLLDHSPRGQHVVFRTRADKGERRRTERELEQTPTERRDVIIIALGRGLGDDIDLAVGQAELW